MGADVQRLVGLLGESVFDALLCFVLVVLWLRLTAMDALIVSEIHRITEKKQGFR